MKVGRNLSSYYVDGLRYPLRGPLRVQDWREFLPFIVSPTDMFCSLPNFRDIVLRDLEILVTEGSDIFLAVGRGYLSPCDYDPSPGSELDGPLGLDLFMSRLCQCMNAASEVKTWLLTPGMAKEDCLRGCFLLGSSLAEVSMNFRGLAYSHSDIRLP